MPSLLVVLTLPKPPQNRFAPPIPSPSTMRRSTRKRYDGQLASNLVYHRDRTDSDMGNNSSSDLDSLEGFVVRDSSSDREQVGTETSNVEPINENISDYGWGQNKSDRASRLRPSKRRRIFSDRDEDDDGGDSTIQKNLSAEDCEPPKLLREDSARLSRHEVPPTSRDYMVKIIFNTSENERLICIAERGVLLRSALYSTLLLPVKFGQYQMPCIQDPNGLTETTAMHAIEYITRNTIPGIASREGSPFLLQQLEDHIRIYDFSIMAGFSELEHAVLRQVAGCPDLEIGLFVKFFTSCYDEDRGHKITRKSSMGKLLKDQLVYHLPAIMKSRHLRSSIQKAGGELAEQLEEVEQEHWMKLDAERRARKPT